MIIPDVNLLIYAYDDRMDRHAEARDWWESTLREERRLGLAWVTLLGFLRLMTNRQVLLRPMSPADAISRVREWLTHPVVEVIAPGEEHAEILFELLEKVGIGGNLTTDAHLAALAIEYQAEIASAGADFGRFPKVRWMNPLKG